MDTTVLIYLEYLGISIAIAISVAETLARYGRVLVLAAQPNEAALVHSKSHLMKVAFYLLALGCICLTLEINGRVSGARESIEAVAGKVGEVLIFLGLMHFCWTFAFQRMRRRALKEAGSAPAVHDFTGRSPSAPPR